jgi:hypothetical protein
MAKIWVLIERKIVADGDEAKALLKKKAVVTKIEKELADRTMAALPSGKYSDKDSDKPKGKRDDYAARAVKIVEKFELKVETQGSKLTVGGTLNMEVELIRSEKEKGELAAAGSKGMEVQRRGTVDTKFDEFLKEVLDAIVGPLAEKLIGSAKFESFAKERRLPLD